MTLALMTFNQKSTPVTSLEETNMDNFGHFTTDNEIKNEILSQVANHDIVRIASINSKCADESQFLRVLDEMVSDCLVDRDKSFIFKHNA
jgi:hypothetical protein